MAFVNNYDLIVDIKKRLASPVPMFRQDDTARLTFKIYDDGVLFDLTGYSRSDVTFQLPSGESLVGNAELVGDKIVYNFVGIELVEEGEVKVTLSIYSGATVVSVQPFVIFVYKRFNSDQASYIGILQELIVNVTQLEIDVRQAISEVNDIKVKYDADSIKLTEGLAKVDKAVVDEQVRESNEAQRIINENERKSNELNRQVTFSSYQDYIEKLEAVGEFILGTQYYKNNIVRDGNGNSYMAKRDNINEPLTSIDDWMVLTKRGEKGDTGASLNIRGVLTEESQLPPVGVSGDAYSVNGSLYIWSEDSNMWVNVGYIKGEKGDQGEQGIRGEKGDIGEITEFKYVIPASNEGQTQVNIPLSTLSPKDALFLTLNGTTLYPDTDYTVSGSIVTLSQPVVDYQNATFFVRILKNIPKGTQIPTADGSLLTDGSVSKQKLELSLQQDIDRVASTTQLGKVKIDGETITIDENGIIKSTIKGYEVKSYNGDLNNLIETGMYQIPNSTLNAPTASPFIIEVIKSSDSSTVIQKATALSNNNNSLILRRTGYNETGNTPYNFRVESGASQINGWSVDSVRLIDSTSSDSITQAPTAKALKSIADKINITPIPLTPDAPFIKSNGAMNDLTVQKIGDTSTLSFSVKNNQQLNTSTTYYILTTIPSGYQPLRSGVAGLAYFTVGGQYYTTSVIISGAGMFLNNVPLTIPIGTIIQGMVTYYST